MYYPNYDDDRHHDIEIGPWDDQNVIVFRVAEQLVERLEEHGSQQAKEQTENTPNVLIIIEEDETIDDSAGLLSLNW